MASAAQADFERVKRLHETGTATEKQLGDAPELILLDEPTTGVDPVSRGEFWNILGGILKQGVTVLMTTPYMDEAERCDRVGLVSEDRQTEETV